MPGIKHSCLFWQCQWGVKKGFVALTTHHEQTIFATTKRKDHINFFDNMVCAIKPFTVYLATDVYSTIVL